MLNKSLSSVIGRDPNRYPDDACGIEVELEPDLTKIPGGFDPSLMRFKKWQTHNDGSLVRGIELVSTPTEISFRTWKDMEKESLYKELADFLKASPCAESERASVHIHFNCLKRSYKQILTLCCAFWMLENLFLDYSGPSRKGNHFCLGISDSMRLIDAVMEKLDDDLYPLIGNNAKYSSLNLGRLDDFGTLEVRTMGSLTDAASIFRWARCVSDFFISISENFESPLEVVEAFSDNPEDFVQTFLPSPVFETLSKVLGHPLEDMVNRCSGSIPILLPLTQIDWDQKSKDIQTNWDTGNRVRRQAPARAPRREEPDFDPFDEDDTRVIEDFDEDVRIPPPTAPTPRRETRQAGVGWALAPGVINTTPGVQDNTLAQLTAAFNPFTVNEMDEIRTQEEDRLNRVGMTTEQFIAAERRLIDRRPGRVPTMQEITNEARNRTVWLENFIGRIHRPGDDEVPL